MAVAAQQQAKAGPAGATIAADVLVVLGIAGDLAKVMTFRLLYRLEAVADQLPDHRGPVSDWSLEDLRNHARSAIETPASRSTRACSRGLRAVCPTSKAASATRRRSSASAMRSGKHSSPSSTSRSRRFYSPR